MEGAEDRVIGIERVLAAEERLRLDREAQRRQNLADGRKSALAVIAKLLESPAEPLLAAFAEIGAVHLMRVLEDVEDQHRN